VKVRHSLLFALCVPFAGSAMDGAQASIAVRIQLARQTMSVAVDGSDLATWPVSTARRGYRTPVGSYRPYSLQRMHYSKLYDYTPMPYSIFFRGGYAIHGTTEVRNLGRPVSHGCIRLSPDNARTLFELVQSHGRQNTAIEIVE
jgi:lipoprotein-anchoring transpeptidase ErfK/SrfK